MRILTVAFLFLFFGSAASAQVTTQVRFLPPNPTSQTAVTARLSGVWHDSNVPRCGDAVLIGQTTINISLSCVALVGLPVLTPWEMDVWVGVLQPGIYNIVVQYNPPAIDPPPIIAQSGLIVQEATPAFALSPNVGFNAAPPPVLISGVRLECPDIQTCAVSVRFGDRAAAVRRVDIAAGQIEVMPPPGSGTVDVTVGIGNGVLRRAVAFHYVDVTKRLPPEFYTPLLFPVFYAGPGAFGSNWETEVSVRNETDSEFWAPHDSAFELICVACDPSPPGSAPPHSTRMVRASRAGMALPNGRLAYIAREAASKLHFGLLVRDLSRQAEALGTEVPVVREAELSGEAFSLLDVPGDGRFRMALRVYSIDQAGAVRLVIRPMDGDAAIVDVQVMLLLSGYGAQRYGSVTIGDLTAAYPQVNGHGPLRIEILPVTPGDLRLWGFVTVTNNETQHVTVISPQ